MAKVEVNEEIARMIQDGEFSGIEAENMDAAVDLFNRIDEACEGLTNDLVMKVATNLIARTMVYGSGGQRHSLEKITAKFALHLKDCVEHHEAVRTNQIPATLK